MKKMWMKHTGSVARDQPIDYECDFENKVISVYMREFDSSLFSDVILYQLPREDILAYWDDNEGWHPKAPPWRIRLHWIGQEFDATVVKLMNLGDGNRDATVVLSL